MTFLFRNTFFFWPSIIRLFIFVSEALRSANPAHSTHLSFSDERKHFGGWYFDFHGSTPHSRVVGPIFRRGEWRGVEKT